MKPSVGRIVHYTPAGGEGNVCMAAVVTFVGHQGAAALTVFYPPLVSQVHPDDLAAVPERQGDTPRGHTWHWPERVE